MALILNLRDQIGLPQIIVALEGGTYTIASTTNFLFIESAAAALNLVTLNFPTAPGDRQPLVVMSVKRVLQLNAVLPVGKSYVGIPVFGLGNRGLGAMCGVAMFYNAATATWIGYGGIEQKTNLPDSGDGL